MRNIADVTKALLLDIQCNGDLTPEVERDLNQIMEKAQWTAPECHINLWQALAAVLSAAYPDTHPRCNVYKAIFSGTLQHPVDSKESRTQCVYDDDDDGPLVYGDEDEDENEDPLPKADGDLSHETKMPAKPENIVPTVPGTSLDISLTGPLNGPTSEPGSKRSLGAVTEDLRAALDKNGDLTLRITTVLDTIQQFKVNDMVPSPSANGCLWVQLSNVVNWFSNTHPHRDQYRAILDSA